jgi:hypothetical protein
MLSISMNDLIGRSTSHKARGSFNGRMYLFGDHQFSFPPGAFAASHQLHRPKRDYAVRFDCQFHQGSVVMLGARCHTQNPLNRTGIQVREAGLVPIEETSENQKYRLRRRANQ